MAGLAAHGRLEPLLAGSPAIRSTHWIESVKLLPPAGHAPTREDLYGDVTSRAVSQIEIVQPQRARTFCMAVTSETPPDQGKPSSWAARIDALAAATALPTPEMPYEAEPIDRIYSRQTPGQEQNALAVG